METIGGIEDAILDSLGGADRIYGRQYEQEQEQGQGGDVEVDGSSLPSRVVVESPTAELGDGLREAVEKYAKDVCAGRFPATEHCFNPPAKGGGGKPRLAAVTTDTARRSNT